MPATELAADTCSWCGTDPMYVAYHDLEWGVPEYDPRALFEKLTLDGFQAGLSWITILRKRNEFRLAFEGFYPEVIASWGEDDVARLLGNPGIVRHRGKIEATIGNARAWVEIESSGSFRDLLWDAVGGEPRQNAFERLADVPAKTEQSVALSKELKRRGFKFVGPTIVYAFMQAVGMVNDHVVGCPRHAELGGTSR